MYYLHVIVMELHCINSNKATWTNIALTEIKYTNA